MSFTLKTKNGFLRKYVIYNKSTRLVNFFSSFRRKNRCIQKREGKQKQKRISLKKIIFTYLRRHCMELYKQ